MLEAPLTIALSLFGEYHYSFQQQVGGTVPALITSCYSLCWTRGALTTSALFFHNNGVDDNIIVYTASIYTDGGSWPNSILVLISYSRHVLLVSLVWLLLLLSFRAFQAACLFLARLPAAWLQVS